MVFEPTERDQRFLDAWCRRKPGKDTISAIQKRAKVGINWYNNRKKNSEWREWFLNEIAAHDRLFLIEVRDHLIRQFQEDMEAGERRPDLNLARFLKEWLEPTVNALELRLQQPEQNVTRRDMIVEIAGFIDQEGDGYCEHCGNPLIPWKLWRRGLERGEEHLLEDGGSGNGEAFYAAEIKQIENEPERTGA